MADWFEQNAPKQAAGGDWFAQNAPKAESPSWLESASRFAKEAWDQVNPVAAVEGLANAVNHPIDTINAIGGAHLAVEKKAEDAFKKGNYTEGVRHVINYLIPVIGPNMDQAGDKLQGGDIAGGLGQTAGLGVSLVAPELVKKIPSIPVLPKIVNQNPAEVAAVRFGEANQIPVSAATATGNTAVKGVQAVADHSPIGSLVAQHAKAAEAKAFTHVGNKIADKVYASPMSPESAGSSVAGAIDNEIGMLKVDADASYKQFRNVEAHPSNLKTIQVGTKQVPTGVIGPDGNPIIRDVPITKEMPLPVDMRPIKESLRPIYDDMKQWMEPAKRNSSAGFTAIESILKGEDYIPASVAEKGLGGLKTLARAENPNLRDVSQGIGANAAQQLQAAIDSTVAGAGKDTLTALQEGRAAHATKMEVAEIAKQLRAEPVQTFNQFLWQKDTGIDMLRKVAAQVPDEMPKIGRAFLDDLLGTATAEGGFNKTDRLLSKWENLGPETKKIIFRNPMLVKDLDNFFLLAKKAAESPNPSGSALVGSMVAGLGYAFKDPITGVPLLIGSGALSKMLHSPAGISALSKGLTVRVGSGPAAALAAGRILKAAGEQAKPMPLAAQNDQSSQTDPSTIAQAQ